MRTVLAQIGKGNDIACLLVVAPFVGDPYFNLVDLDAAGYIRHARHRFFVSVTEEMGEEEMSVLVVTVAGDVEPRHLRAALAADGLRLAVLLADQGLDAELAELQVGLDTEQRLAAADKRRRQVHRHITCLDRLDDVILLAFVVQFEVLLVERERGLGVVTHVEVQLLAYLALDAGLDLLVEIEDVIVSRPHGKRRVRDILVLETEKQLGASLHLELHTARTEHFVRRTDVEFHVGDVELGLVVMLYFSDLLLPVPVHHLTLRVVVVFVLREHVRRCDVGLADAGVNDISACLRLIFNGGGDVVRVLQVKRTDGLLQFAEVLHAQLLHFRRSPDSAVGLRHIVRCALRAPVTRHR